MIEVGILRTLSHVTSFALLGGIGFGLYDFHVRGQHESHFNRARAEAILIGVQEPEPPVGRSLDYKNDILPAIVEFDWTGRVEAASGTTIHCGGPTPEPPIQHIEEILSVVFIMASSDAPSDCCCLVRLNDEASADVADLWLFIGDSLPVPHNGVSLQSVSPDSVTFSFADPDRQAESLALRSTLGTSQIGSIEGTRIARETASHVARGHGLHSKTTPLTTELRNGQYYVGTEDAENLSENYVELLARDLDSETHYDRDGRRKGLKITRLAKGSLGATHGLQEGDIIKSINGHPVNSKQEAIAFAKENGDRYSIWQVEIENLGRTRLEIYHSPGN